MALPHHYLLALISPNARLGQFHFAVLAVVIAAAHLYIYAHMPRLNVQNPWNFYSIALLALIWCKFCILSRRLHDTGSNGLIAVPVLLVATLAYLCIIDPSLLGASESKSGALGFVTHHAMSIVRTLFIAVFIYCIRAGGETGPNAYGPEFGDDGDGISAARDALDKKRDTTMPVHSFRKLGKQVNNGWGERRRPAGFGRR